MNVFFERCEMVRTAYKGGGGVLQWDLPDQLSKFQVHPQIGFANFGVQSFVNGSILVKRELRIN